MVQVPASNKSYHIIGYKAIITPNENEPFVHHITIYTCQTKQIHHGLEMKKIDKNMCGRGGIMHVWDVGGVDEIYDAAYGYKVNGGDYLLLEIHYDNPNLIEDIVPDSSGLMLLYTSKLRESNIKMFNVANIIDNPLNFFIPPHLSNVVAYGYCSKYATTKLIPQNGITVHKVYLRAHSDGRQLILRHIRNGVELPPIAATYDYDFNFQEILELKTPILVQRGDELIVECHYDTMSTNDTVYHGDSSENEMCFAGLFVTSQPDMSDPYCLSMFTDRQIDEWLDVPQKRGWYNNDSMFYDASDRDSAYYYRRMWHDIGQIGTVNVDNDYNLIGDYQMFSDLPLNYERYMIYGDECNDMNVETEDIQNLTFNINYDQMTESDLKTIEFDINITVVILFTLVSITGLIVMIVNYLRNVQMACFKFNNKTSWERNEF